MIKIIVAQMHEKEVMMYYNFFSSPHSDGQRRNNVHFLTFIFYMHGG